MPSHYYILIVIAIEAVICDSFMYSYMLQATQRNICNVLGTSATNIKMTKSNIKNGFKLKGFLSRYDLENLQSEFHVYVARDNTITVITRGRLSKEGKC